MADVKWIKLSTGLFDNRKIKQIEKMPEGDALIVIWLKLLVLAGDVNDGGWVYFTKEIPYTDQLLANEFRRPLQIVQLALATFQKFGMVEIVEDIIHVSNWEKYQNVESMDRIREQTRLRVAKHREQKRLLGSVTGNVTVTQGNATDKDIEEDKEEDIYGGGSAADGIIAYASNNLTYISPTNMQELDTFRGDLGDDLVRYAIDEACANGKRTYAYVRSILNRIIERGFKTLGEVKAAEEERKKKLAGGQAEKQAVERQAQAAQRSRKPMDERKYTDADFGNPLDDMMALMNRPRSGAGA